MASATPAVLRWARETSGLSNELAAKRIGVKPEVLAAAEERTATLTIAQLMKAAHVYKRPLAAFFLKEPPEERSVVADFRRLPDAADTLSPELRLELRRLNRKREIAARLAPQSDDGTQNQWNFVGSVREVERSQHVAKFVREALHVTADARKLWTDEYKTFNWWKERVEALGVLVFLVRRIDVAEMRGFSIARAPFPVIALNRSDSPRARLFSLVHELTHVLLGNSGLCDLEEDDYENQPERRRVEVFCNAVAADTLMPRNEVLNHHTVKAHGSKARWRDDELRAIAREFGVSNDAMLYRLVKLQLATIEEYRAASIQWRAAAEARAEEQGGFAPERAHEIVLRTQGKPYVQIVLAALHNDEITAADVADYLDIKLDHLDNLERAAIGLDVPKVKKPEQEPEKGATRRGA